MKEKSTNQVHIVGYLKENNLESVQAKDGSKVIRGSLNIAISDDQSYKVSFYVNESKSEKAYASLNELLPSKTLSIVDYLKSNNTSNFSTAANASTKVWVNAHLEEFVSASNGREISLIQIKGYSGGLKSATDRSPFAPRAEFECDAYVDDIHPAKDLNDEETGDLEITCLLPAYKNNMYKVNFVARKDNASCYDYFKNKCPEQSTLYLKGNLIRLRKQIRKVVDTEGCFGSVAEEQYDTQFVSEQVIVWGKQITGSDAISVEEAREGLATRENIKNDNAAKKQNQKKNEPAPKQEETRVNTKDDDDDFGDF